MNGACWRWPWPPAHARHLSRWTLTLVALIAPNAAALPRPCGRPVLRRLHSRCALMPRFHASPVDPTPTTAPSTLPMGHPILQPLHFYVDPSPTVERIMLRTQPPQVYPTPIVGLPDFQPTLHQVGHMQTQPRNLGLRVPHLHRECHPLKGSAPSWIAPSLSSMARSEMHMGAPLPNPMQRMLWKLLRLW